MKEVDIAKLLEAHPGSIRAADGVILVDEGSGSSFYVTDIFETDPDLLPGEHMLIGFCSKNEILRIRDLRTAHDRLLHLRVNSIADSTRIQRTFSKRRKIF